jgi:hypothetical protein
VNSGLEIYRTWQICRIRLFYNPILRRSALTEALEQIALLWGRVDLSRATIRHQPYESPLAVHVTVDLTVKDMAAANRPFPLCHVKYKCDSSAAHTFCSMFPRLSGPPGVHDLHPQSQWTLITAVKSVGPMDARGQPHPVARWGVGRLQQAALSPFIQAKFRATLAPVATSARGLVCVRNGVIDLIDADL